MKKQYRSLDDFAAWELDAYADGETMPHVATFLEQNPAIKAKWRQQQKRNAQLQQTLHRFDCPDPEQLRDFFWNLLSTSEQHRLESHIQQCPHCSAELAHLQSFMLEDDPAWQPQSAATPSTPTFSERVQALADQMRLVIATLVTPLTPQMATVALRGGATATQRVESPVNLLFEAEGADISLVVERDAQGRLNLAGQIFTLEPDTPTGGKLVAADPTLAPRPITIDEAGTFVLSDVPAGAYQLLLFFPQQALVVPNLVL